MSDPLRRPLHGVAVYNPDLLSKEELIAQFVARRPLLQRFLEDLRREGTAQHHLIIGQRGMGKTTLLRRLRYAIEEDAALSRIWLPLTFPEEQYNVARLSDFYLNCIDALGDALENLDRHADAKSLDQAVADLPSRDEMKRAQKALEILRGGARLAGRRLLLLVDNIELILDRLKSEQWAIRELLSADGWLLLIGASASTIEATYKYQEPFYDFFQVHELRGLSESESHEVLRHLARVSQSSHVERILDEDPARLRAIHVLTGGNPRTIVLLSSVLAQGPLGDVRSDLEKLLDLCTPLYKSRFEALPAQSQHVVDALAVYWHPISAGELAGIIRLDTNTVSAQLNRLCQQGLVEKVAYEPATRTGFQIAERFFNIWYLMRASRRVRRRLLWLVEFLRMLYGHVQVERQARQHLNRSEAPVAGGGLRHAEYGLALAEVVEDQALRRALESASMRTLMLDRSLREKIGSIVDLEGVDTALKPLAERHRMMAEIREAVMSAKVRKARWDADSFWQMLGGAPSLGQAEKMRIAASLPRLRASQLSSLRDYFDDEFNRFAGLLGVDVANDLCKAFRGGYMIDLEDVQGAEAAALVFDAGWLRASVLAMRLEKAFDRESMVEFERAVEGATCSYPWAVLGNLLKDHLGRYEESEAAYRKAIEIDPKCANAWNGLGNLLQDHLDRYAESEAAYRRAIEIDPNNSSSWDRLGGLLQYRLGRYEESEAAYRRAIEIDPNDSSSWDGLGSLLQYRLGRYEESEAAYRRAIEIDPDDSSLWSWLGDLLQNHLRRYEDSEAAYRKAIEINPMDAHSWSMLGHLLEYHLGRYEESGAAYRKAIEIDPNDSYSWRWLADLLQRHLGRYEESEAVYRKAINIDPKNAYSWSGLGDLLQDHLGRCEESEAAYRKAIETDPENAYSWRGLGDLLQYRLGRYEESEAAYRTATEVNPRSACAWNSLAWLRYERDRVDEETEAAARQAVALAPQDNDYVRALGTILVRRGRWEEAAEQARQFIGSGTTEFDEQAWADTILFFREAVAIGRAQDAASLLDDLGMGERWQPLREALLVLASGTPSRLRRVAPEIRQPAEQLISMLSSGPEKTSAGK